MQRGVGAVTTTKHTENGVVVTITTCIHGRSRRSGHGLTTFSATNFFHYSLPFKVIAQPPPLKTALRHYMAGPLFKSRLRPCGGVLIGDYGVSDTVSGCRPTEGPLSLAIDG